MEDNHTPTQPQTPTESEAQIPQPPTTPEPPITPQSPVSEMPITPQPEGQVKSKSNKILFIGVVILILAIIGTAIYLYFQSQNKNEPLVMPTTYEECEKAEGSVIQESYPATCVTKEGSRFIQPLSEEQKKDLQPPTLIIPLEETKDWQGYKSSTYSFKYPHDWHVLTFPGNENMILVASKDITGTDQISDDNPNYLRIMFEVCYELSTEEEVPCGTYEQRIFNITNVLDSRTMEQQKIIVNDVNGTLITGMFERLQINEGDYRAEAIFSLGAYQLSVIAYNPVAKNVFDQIISTFEFLDTDKKTSCMNAALQLSVRYSPNDWECKTDELSGTDGWITLSSENFKIDFSNLGRGGPCSQGPDAVCEEEKFFSNEVLSTKLYMGNTEKGEVFGNLTRDKIAAWISITYTGSDNRTMRELTNVEEEDLKQILSSVKSTLYETR